MAGLRRGRRTGEGSPVLQSLSPVESQHGDLQVGMTSSIGGVDRQAAGGGRQPSEVLAKRAGICGPGRH